MAVTRQVQQQQVTDNAPLRSGKGSLYEGGIREPLIVSWPGVTPRGAVCHEPVISTDLFYTLLDMAGLSAPRTPRRTARLSRRF